MKVRVAYTVDHDEVPKIVEELIALCRTELRVASDFRFDVRNLAKTSEDVAKLKNTLDILASRLDDCVNLCSGYDGVVASQSQVLPLDAEEAEDE